MKSHLMVVWDMWIKIHYNKTTFILKFSYFTIFAKKICFKIFRKDESYRSFSGIRTLDLHHS